MYGVFLYSNFLQFWVSSFFFVRTTLMHCPCRQNYFVMFFHEKMSDGRNLLQFSLIFPTDREIISNYTNIHFQFTSSVHTQNSRGKCLLFARSFMLMIALPEACTYMHYKYMRNFNLYSVLKRRSPKAVEGASELPTTTELEKYGCRKKYDEKQKG